MKRAAAGLAVLLAGCSGRQNALDYASDQARAIGDIWQLMLVVCGLMYLLMMALLAWAIWRAKRRSPDAAPRTDAPAADATLRRLLIGWTALIVVGLFVLAGGSFLVDRRLAHAEDPHALQVRITAAEWWWQVEYLDPDPSRTSVTANELHLPVDRATRIELRSNDVIHSFWVPNLNGKTDLIPGRSNFQTITPRRTGRWRGQCAEFCGLEHARMALRRQRRRCGHVRTVARGPARAGSRRRRMRASSRGNRCFSPAPAPPATPSPAPTRRAGSVRTSPIWPAGARSPPGRCR